MNRNIRPIADSTRGDFPLARPWRTGKPSPPEVSPDSGHVERDDRELRTQRAEERSATSIPG
jgi:hypothetical protein